MPLADVFIKYGGSRYGVSARHGYKLAGDTVELSLWEQMIPQALKDIPDVATFAKDIQGVGISLTSPRIGHLSSQLISVCPGSNRQPEVMLVSKHITLNLYDVVLRHDYQKFWQYFNQFWGVSQSHGAAGWLWEAHAICHVLHGSYASASYSLLTLTQPHSGSLVVELPFCKSQEHGNVESLAQHLAEIVPSFHEGSNCLFIPGAKNHATSDAFSVSASSNVSLFQATIVEDGDHCTQATGLTSYGMLWLKRRN
jgi:hypothetical protein